MTTPPNIVLAVDPGTAKCGVAVVERREPPLAHHVRHRAVVETARLEAHVRELLRSHPVGAVLVGDATGGRALAETLRALLPPGVPLHPVPEAHTSERARARYLAENPPRGLLARLVPAGMRVPPVPVDDYVAVILAETFFAAGTPPAPRP